ncbi:MAG TPA: hypothetical protein VH796_04420 [Nitrososphaeraceae archaeon]|jgi:hypothetical protein
MNSRQSRQQELIDKITELDKTVPNELVMPTPKSQEEASRFALEKTKHLLYLCVIKSLKEFLIERNCEGKKPEIIVSSPYETDYGTTEDRVYLPYNEPKNRQVMFDTLKQYQIITDNAVIDDYSFLFND